MVKRFAAALLCITLTIVLFGCAYSEKNFPSEDKEQTADAPGTSDPDETLLGDIDNTPPAPEEEDEPPASDLDEPAVKTEPDAYTADDIVPLFSMTEQEILSIYGEPAEKRPLDIFGIATADEYVYENGTILGFEYFSDLVEPTLFWAAVADDKIPAPRGVMIGDTPEEVMSCFKGGGLGEPDVWDEDETLEFRMIYGEYAHMEDFGLALYDGNNIAGLIYSSDGTSLKFDFTDGKLSLVTYTVSLT